MNECRNVPLQDGFFGGGAAHVSVRFALAFVFLRARAVAAFVGTRNLREAFLMGH